MKRRVGGRLTPLPQRPVRIEGALVVCAGTGDTSVFKRTIRELRESVLAPAPRR